MKNISKSLLAIAVAGVAFVASCKKGEDDPSLSLRSRKSRVAGEWKVSSAETKMTTTGSAGTSTSSSTSTETWTGDTYKASESSTYSSGGSSSSSTSTIDGTVETNTYTFEKDGTWKQNLKYTTTETETDDVFGGQVKTTTVTNYTISKSGVWNFLGKVQDDTKNKEEMSVSTTSEDRSVTTTVTSVYTPTGGGTTTTTTSTSTDSDVDTYANNERAEIWKIKQLKNKEMIITRTGKGSSTDTNSTTSGSTTNSSTSTSSHEMTGTMTLTQE